MHRYLLGLVALTVFIALPHSASAQPARFWVEVQTAQPGTQFQYKHAGDPNWTNFTVGVPVEVFSDLPLEVRNIGTITGAIVSESSSTGNINAIDGVVPYWFEPFSWARFRPDVIHVIAGNIKGFIKGILNIVGSLFSMDVGAADQGTSKTMMVTTSATGELALSAEASDDAAACFAVQCDNGGHSIVALSQADPTPRSLQGAGAAVCYDAAGNMTSYTPLGQITNGPCDAIIPTLSEWGLIVLTLLLLAAGMLVVMRQRRRPVAA